MYYIVQLCITFTHLAKDEILKDFPSFWGKMKDFSHISKDFLGICITITL